MKLFAVAVVVALFFVLPGGRGYSKWTSQVQKPADDRFVLGFTRDLFADVHIPDALTAMKIWAAELKKQRGFEGPTETVVYDDPQSVFKAVQQNGVDLLIVSALGYLKIQNLMSLEPHFVVQRGSSVTDQILLLVHRKSGITGLKDLENSDLICLHDARSNIGRLWLETLLLENGYQGLNNFFRQIKTTVKSSRTILPVFFRQVEACLIHRAAFEMMAELNPQIKKDLVVLASSPETIPSITCIRTDYDAERKEALIDALKTLHEEPRGQQILMLFREDRLVPFKASYLDSVDQLLRKHSSLMKNLEKTRTQDNEVNPLLQRDMR
jgi:phosphonate transport system substrate-binding protein